MGPEWSPEVYGRHAAPQLRPALDLLGRIPIANAETVVDLGCGSGALFPALRARFATARLMGIDSSPAMLERARAVDPDVELVEADAAFWRPGSTVDLIVANASLQLISGHERLIPELLGCCRCLAVQVPDNFAAPSHRLVRETMAQAPWSDQLAGVELGDRILSAEAYANLLRGEGLEPDLWRTTYYHRLVGQAPVLYPTMADGVVLFPFTRLFFVATRPDG